MDVHGFSLVPPLVSWGPRMSNVWFYCWYHIVFISSISQIPPWPPIGWDIFNFSATAERILTKFDREQVFSVLYNVWLFYGSLKNRYGRPGLRLAETFSTYSLQSLNRIRQILIESKYTRSVTKFTFFGPINHQRWSPDLWLAETFLTLSATPQLN